MLPISRVGAVPIAPHPIRAKLPLPPSYANHPLLLPQINARSRVLPLIAPTPTNYTPRINPSNTSNLINPSNPVNLSHINNTNNASESNAASRPGFRNIRVNLDTNGKRNKRNDTSNPKNGAIPSKYSSNAKDSAATKPHGQANSSKLHSTSTPTFSNNIVNPGISQSNAIGTPAPINEVSLLVVLLFLCSFCFFLFLTSLYPSFF